MDKNVVKNLLKVAKSTSDLIFDNDSIKAWKESGFSKPFHELMEEEGINDDDVFLIKKRTCAREVSIIEGNTGFKRMDVSLKRDTGSGLIVREFIKYHKQ